MNEAFRQLFDPQNLPDLGPGPRKGRLSVSDIDGALKRAFAAQPPGAATRELVRALALLWHDHHDAAHALVQDASGGEGAYIHGMLHRREPDFWNAKYWFRRVGQLPFLGPLAEELESIKGGEVFVSGGVFDPSRFTDAVESGRLPEETLKRIQAAEFQAVLDHLAG